MCYNDHEQILYQRRDNDMDNLKTVLIVDDAFINRALLKKLLSGSYNVIEAEDGKINGKKFANKVLKYLWADVFKRNTDKIFKSKNLSKMVDDFTGTDAFDKVFVEDFVKSLNDANDEIKNHE